MELVAVVVAVEEAEDVGADYGIETWAGVVEVGL